MMKSSSVRGRRRSTSTSSPEAGRRAAREERRDDEGPFSFLSRVGRVGAAKKMACCTDGSQSHKAELDARLTRGDSRTTARADLLILPERKASTRGARPSVVNTLTADGKLDCAGQLRTRPHEPVRPWRAATALARAHTRWAGSRAWPTRPHLLRARTPDAIERPSTRGYDARRPRDTKV